MSMFLEPDEENLPVEDEQSYSMSYPSTPSTHTTQSGQDLFDAGNAWAAICTSADESYRIAQPMVWPSELGLGVPSTHMSTQSMLADPSLATFNTVMPASWPSSMGILMPSSTYRETRHDSLMQPCYPLSGFLPIQPETSWNVPHCSVASFRPSYELSPGQSDFSTSSQASCVAPSSPYAHSEGCYPRTRSPMIKIEEDHIHVVPRLRSVSSSTSPRTRHSHVNPGDIYNPPDIESSEQPASPPLVPVKVEQDTKPILRPRPSGQQPSAPVEDTRQSLVEDRRKRGYTTPMNAVCSCDECGKLFQRTSNLKAHLDTHKPDREQPWACQFYGCARRFVRKTDMTRHQESVHIKSRNFQCGLCYGSFSRKDTLRRHLDDGCPRRAQHRQYLKRDRRASASRPSSHDAHWHAGDISRDIIAPKVENFE